LDLHMIVSALFQAIYWLIFARIILSFLVAFIRLDPHHPIIRFINEITEPIMAPFRRFIPPIGGMDFSPIVVFLVLNLLEKWIKDLL